MKYLKLRKSMLLGGMLTVIGAALRVIGASQRDSLGPGNAYIIIMTGQAFG
jgi:hypothetical protein